MKNIFGLSIPQTLEEVCDPQRVALLVYDMQVGILSQIKNPEQITLQVLQGVKRGPSRRSSRIIFAASLIAKRINGHVSIPDGYGMATNRLARTDQTMVSARRSFLSNYSGVGAATD
jgi:hypothetical protein